MTITVSERPRRAIGGTVAYETNYGPTVQLYWEHRNLFGRAERLRLEGEVARLGTSGGFDQMTYRAFATLRTPAAFGTDLTMVVTLGALALKLAFVQCRIPVWKGKRPRGTVSCMLTRQQTCLSSMSA